MLSSTQAEDYMTIFNLGSPEDFYAVVVRPRYEEFLEEKYNIGMAVTAVITAYQLFEWVNPIERGDRTPIKELFENRYPDYPDVAEAIDIAKKIVDGLKHNEEKIVSRVEGSFNSAFSDGFARKIIFVGKDDSEILVDDLLHTLNDFWKNQHTRGWP
jgi:hypothetical protein